MQMLEDLKPLWLYSSRRKLHIPFNPSNKKKGARIELLTRDLNTSNTLMRLPYLYNPKLFYSYYMNRNVMSYIDSSGIIDDIEEEDEDEALIEATFHIGEFNKVYIDSDGTSNDRHIMYRAFTKNKIKKYYEMFGLRNHDWKAVTIYGFNDLAQMAKAINGEAIIQYGDIVGSFYFTETEIFILNRSAFSEIQDQEIDYEKYCKKVLIAHVAMNSSRNCSRELATAIGLSLSGQADDIIQARQEKDQGIPDIISVAKLVSALYEDKRTAGLKKLIRTGDTTVFAKYKIDGIKKGIKDLIIAFTPKHESFVLENGDLTSVLESTVTDDQICVATDLHFIGYNDTGDKIVIKPKSYIDAVIEKQNKLTGKDGVFICLGDLFYKAYRDEYDFPKDQREFAKEVTNRFTGKYKILVRGNHDRMPDEFYLKDCGFTHVCSSLTYTNILFTHQPEIVPTDMVNIHGHIHGTRQYIEGKPRGYIDVYTMNNQHCDTLENILAAQKEYEKTIKQGSDIDKVDPHLFIPGERRDLEDILKEMTIGESYLISNGNILLEDYNPAEDKTYRRTKSGAHNPFWFVKQFSQDIANTGVKRPKGDPTISGDYESLRPWLLSLVDKAKDIKRIQYLRSDAYQAANQLTKLAKNMRDVQNGTQNRYVDVKYINKMLNGGNTPEKVEAHVRWLKGEYLRVINKKATELRKSGQYESALLESDGNHREAVRIYAAMNDKEREYLAGGYDFINMPGKEVIYRHVIRNNILDLKGFIEVTADKYCDQRSGTTGSIIIGVHPRHRGEGVGTELVKTMLKEIRKENPNLSNLVWRVENSNKKSYTLAEKNGFKLVRKQSTRSMLRYSFIEEKEYKDLDPKILNENALAKKMAKFKFVNNSVEGDTVRSIKEIERTMSGTSFDAAYLTSCYLQRMGLWNAIMGFIEINTVDNFIANTHFFNVATYDFREFFVIDSARKDFNGKIAEITTNPNSLGDYYAELYIKGNLYDRYRSTGMEAGIIPGVDAFNFTNVQYNEIKVGDQIYDDGGCIIDVLRAFGEQAEDNFFKTSILESTISRKIKHIPLPTSMISEAYRTGLVDDGYKMYDNYLIDHGNNVAYFFETDNDDGDEVLTEADKSYDAFLRRYLFRKRLKNTKSLIDFYNNVKEMNPSIRKTYAKLKTYSALNVFIDYSYYNGLFLTNCKKIKDYAVKMYWDFMNRLLEQTDEIRSKYPYSVIFIPVMPGAWDVKPRTYVWDYMQNINPISVIFRMLKNNPDELRTKWAGKKFLFVSPKGYFTLDFATLEYKNISKLKRIVNKMMSGEEITEDEEEDGYTSEEDTDTPTAIAVKIIDKIENKAGIAIDDLTPIMRNLKTDKSPEIPLMRIRSDNIDVIDNLKAGVENRTAIGILVPDQDAFADVVNKNNLSRNWRVGEYYVP